MPGLHRKPVAAQAQSSHHYACSNLWNKNDTCTKYITYLQPGVLLADTNLTSMLCVVQHVAVYVSGLLIVLCAHRKAVQHKTSAAIQRLQCCHVAVQDCVHSAVVHAVSLEEEAETSEARAPGHGGGCAVGLTVGVTAGLAWEGLTKSGPCVEGCVHVVATR